MRIAIALALAASLAAADQPPPSHDGAATVPSHAAGTEPGNGGVDPVTARRAEKAAQDYLDQQEANKTPVDADSASALADAEVLLLEAKAFIDQGDAAKAGEKYVDAAAKMKAIKPDQHAKLGDRYRKASAKLTEVGRALLSTTAVDPASAPTKDPGALSPAEAPAEAPPKPDEH